MSLFCRICLNETLRPKMEVRGEHLGICPNCGLLQLDRSPSSEELDAIYSERYFKDQKYGWDTAAIKEQDRRLALIAAQGITAGAPVLDFGCATGDFLFAAMDRYEMWGFDYSGQAAEIAVTRLPKLARRIDWGGLSRLPKVAGGFAAIAAWDVLEHLDKPREVLDALWGCLRPGGVLFFSLPNAGAPIARIMGSRWAFMTPPEHINYFSRSNLNLLLQACGLGMQGWMARGKWINLGFLAYKLNRVFPGILPKAVLDPLMKSRLGSLVLYIPTRDIQYAAAAKLC